MNGIVEGNYVGPAEEGSIWLLRKRRRHCSMYLVDLRQVGEGRKGPEKVGSTWL